MTAHRLLPWLVLPLAASCAWTEVQEFALPVRGSGVAAVDVPARNGWTIRLQSARVAVGPAYFCATTAASADLCDVAVAEMRDVGVINALDTALQDLPTGRGTTGYVESAQYDLGVSWTQTQQDARPWPAAPGGHSVQLAGTATRGADVVAFTADVDLLPQNAGSRAVQGARTRGHAVDGASVRVVVDPNAWVVTLDMDEYAGMEQPVHITPGSRAYNALVLQLSVNAPPVFTWEEP